MENRTPWTARRYHEAGGRNKRGAKGKPRRDVRDSFTSGVKQQVGTLRLYELRRTGWVIVDEIIDIPFSAARHEVVGNFLGEYAPNEGRRDPVFMAKSPALIDKFRNDRKQP